MKNLLKLSLYVLLFVPVVNALGFTRWGQKLSRFGRIMVPGVAVALVIQQLNQIETSQVLSTDLQNQDLKEEFKNNRSFKSNFFESLRKGADFLSENYPHSDKNLMLVPVSGQRSGYGQRLQLADGRVISCEHHVSHRGSALLHFKSIGDLDKNEKVLQLIKDVLEQGETPARKSQIQAMLGSSGIFIGGACTINGVRYPGWLASHLSIQDCGSGGSVNVSVGGFGYNNGVTKFTTGNRVVINGQSVKNSEKLRFYGATQFGDGNQIGAGNVMVNNLNPLIPTVVMQGGQNAMSFGGGQIVQSDGTGNKK